MPLVAPEGQQKLIWNLEPLSLSEKSGRSPSHIQGCKARGGRTEPSGFHELKPQEYWGHQKGDDVVCFL